MPSVVLTGDEGIAYPIHAWQLHYQIIFIIMTFNLRKSHGENILLKPQET